MKLIFEKYKKMSVQAKSAVWFATCSLYLSWLQILTIITSLYLYHGVFNNAMVKYEEDRDRYISSMQGLTISITAVVFFVYLAFHEMWSRALGLAPIVIILMFIEMTVTPALSFWSGRQRFEYKYQRLVAVTLGKSIVNPLLGLISVLLVDDKATARITSVVIVEVVFCGTIMVKQFKDGKCFFNKTYWKYALGLAIPLLPHYLSSMILNQGDRIMINKMVGTSEVAFYSVAYNIGMLVQIFTTAINNSLTPWVYQKIKADSYAGISKTINMLLVLVAGIAAALMMCSPELVLIFGSSEYASAAYVIPPVAASVFFIFLYNILAIPQFYFEKTQFLLISSVTAAVVNLGLNYVFIKMFGYVAAGYTTLACYVLYSIGHFFISTRVVKKFIPGKRLFDAKVITLLPIAVIGVGVSCNFLFDYWYVRCGIMVLGFALVVAKRNSITALISGIRKK